MKLVIPIDNTDSTISRAIARTIIEQLIFSTEMPIIKDVLYVQRGGIAPQAQTNTAEETLKLDVEDHILVEYKEPLDQNTFDMTKDQVEYPPIFRADKLGINITPMHCRVQMELTVTYRSKSYGVLTNWLNAFRRRLLTAEAINYHDVLYNYAIPVEIAAYLQQVYTLTENVRGYGKTLREFITDHFAPQGLIVRRNLNDSQQTLAFNIKNTGCLGNFTSPPELADTTKEPPQSEVSFTYVIDYDRVTALILEYQMIIHNQVIDLIHIKKYADKRLHSNLHLGHKTFSQSVNNITENQYRLIDYPDRGNFTGDGWRPANKSELFGSSHIISIQLDLTNLSLILPLSDLISLGYPDWLIPILIHYKDRITTMRAFPVLFELFEVNDKESMIPITVNDNNEIIAKFDLEPRNRYYLRVSTLFDLLSMEFAWLQMFPDLLLLFLQWIDALNRGFNNFSDNNYGLYTGVQFNLKTIGIPAKVTDSSLWDALNLINRSDLKKLNTQVVGDFAIHSRNMTKLNNRK